MDITEVITNGLTEKSLPECFQLGINPQKDGGGYSPPFDPDGAEEFGDFVLQLAISISKSTS